MFHRASRLILNASYGPRVNRFSRSGGSWARFMRLDQAIPQRYPQLSRRKARELITQRRVLVNDRPVGVASREVGDGDRITIIEELLELEILREERDWVAVNKPPGLATQPDRERRRRSLEELL